MGYDFSTIEKKWQKRWESEGTFNVERDPDREKFYCLEMFPYPSGALHMGHLRNYSIGDMLARFLMMEGKQVLHPMGYDAFGLPAENAAIKYETHPHKWTWDNIEHMTDQLKRMGCSYDWRRRVETCNPNYYHWTQWLFLQFHRKGLAYRKTAPVNWCESCGTVLANEQVINDGHCWRCATPVVKKNLEQWFLRITDYAQELLDSLEDLPGWPERVKLMQRNWIGRSEGVRLRFALYGNSVEIETFTTRIDTIFGVTFLALSPEHPAVSFIADRSPKKDEIEEFVTSSMAQTEREQAAAGGEKRGIDTGLFAVNPVNGERVPVWIANYILMEYGTGAIMGVPAHDQRDFDFARKYSIPVIPVINPPTGEVLDGKTMDVAFEEDGIQCNSGKFDGMPSSEALPAMTQWFVSSGWGEREINFRLRDWLISRQRYWGAPIPIIYCDKCGAVPVPESDLPVELPLDIKMRTGVNPLATAEEWKRVPCPKCGGPGIRETDTMDTFICSSWYFLRFASPWTGKAPFETDDTDYWMAVDQYIGGIEHACLHLIYARFFTKFLADCGMLKVREPFTNLLTQGMVIKDGAKMSKSRGNVVDPDEIITKWGADTARLFILFASPPEKDLDWSDQGVEGAHRFLQRVYRLVETNQEGLRGASKEVLPMASISDKKARDLKRRIHYTIQRVTRDIEEEKQFNTAVARLMELSNDLGSFSPASGDEWALFREGVEVLLTLLTPIAPHICEEMWEMTEGEGLISERRWPQVDESALVLDNITVVFQVNGKVREQVDLPAGLDPREMEEAVLSHEAVARRLQGKEIIRVITVPDKLVNVVVKG
ncbi:MAG: leucine--tRNA ligase [Thermovirgaceae bacterium]|jgi:leucyl-tRNA synthetase|nr:leucine--tRNA ligase [Synergistales bacterium]MDI9392744.1 leucine--tRNA ligase [Synergistota bacterium]NLV64604.1 leucine--tRNA ligase [Synergistaceae bacterium]HRW88118.1 leucine--tRNA ligase [Thermovirgaceae bacterium]MDD3830462.1 leucine--tRNA ligase [Synergistales bacterium]